MVSLFTQLVAGNIIEVPPVDRRVKGHKRKPVVVSQDDGPAVPPKPKDKQVAPDVASPASNKPV